MKPSGIKPLCEIVFPSQEALQKALSPLSINEVVARVANAPNFPIQFRIDPAIKTTSLHPLRNIPNNFGSKIGSGKLLHTPLFKTKTLTVFYPEAPRVPHHLTIALNRRNVQGTADLTPEENGAIFRTIRKIAEIYKTVGIRGFVIAQYDTPQKGHMGRYVVEVIPHLPRFKEIKNTVDKADCNRYVLFRHANLSPLPYPRSPDAPMKEAELWKEAFQKEQKPLSDADTKISFPHVRKESDQSKAESMLFHHVKELLQDQGGVPNETSSFQDNMPTEVSKEVKSITVEKCPFCDETIFKRQLVYEYQDIAVFYNVRKGAKPGANFLILPKRHVEKVYNLSPKEIETIRTVRSALVEVLKETHPECQVAMYIQDDPATGQTVFHSHEQVVAIDPKTIALTWTLMSLYPSGNVSDEEMVAICKEFGLKLDQKIEEITAPLQQRLKAARIPQEEAS